MNKIFSILLLAVLVSYCKEEDIQPVAEKIYFTGLTQTDIYGWPLTIDTSDWKTTEIWVKQETDLFANVYQSGCVQSYNNQITVYPNPSYGNISFALDKLVSTRVEMRLVDEDFKTLFSIDSITSSYITFNGMDFGIKDTIRVYYKFIENNCEFNGHGDILIK